ncbi:ATP-binding cassette domain-containing protein [Halolamina salina]
MAAIETHDLTKRYGDVVALDGLDLTVREGEVFGFLGPNGAGKSTAINILLGLVRPTAGSGRVLGHDVRSESRELRRRIGILPEGYSTYDRLTAREHLDYAIAAKGADDDPDALLDRTGLEPAARDRRAGGYSKGMQQRLALAIALVGDPDLLILDEPSSGLDPSGMADVRRLVREEAADGTTVFFSSHLLPAVEAVCDRVGILRDGRLATVDTVDGLRETLRTESTVTLQVDGEPEADLLDVPGVSAATATGSELRVTCTEPTAKATVISRVAATTTIRDVTIDDASLDDLFETVTAADGAADARPPEVDA